MSYINAQAMKLRELDNFQVTISGDDLREAISDQCIYI